MQHSPHKHYLFSVRDTEAFSFIFFWSFFFFPLFLDFIFLTLSTSFLSPGSPIVTTEVLLCLLVILFQDHFDFSLVETSSSGSKKKITVLSAAVPASVSQCDRLLWINSLSSDTESLHSRFSCSEKHLGRGQRLQGISQLLKKVHLLVAAKHSYFFGMNICSSSCSYLPTSARSHRHQFSKACWLRAVV